MMDKYDKRYSYISCTLKIKKHLFFNFYNYFRNDILPFFERVSDAVEVDVLEYVKESNK